MGTGSGMGRVLVSVVVIMACVLACVESKGTMYALFGSAFSGGPTNVTTLDTCTGEQGAVLKSTDKFLAMGGGQVSVDGAGNAWMSMLGVVSPGRQGWMLVRLDVSSMTFEGFEVTIPPRGYMLSVTADSKRDMLWATSFHSSATNASEPVLVIWTYDSKTKENTTVVSQAGLIPSGGGMIPVGSADLDPVARKLVVPVVELDTQVGKYWIVDADSGAATLHAMPAGMPGVMTISYDAVSGLMYGIGRQGADSTFRTPTVFSYDASANVWANHSTIPAAADHPFPISGISVIHDGVATWELGTGHSVFPLLVSYDLAAKRVVCTPTAVGRKQPQFLFAM